MQLKVKASLDSPLGPRATRRPVPLDSPLAAPRRIPAGCTSAPAGASGAADRPQACALAPRHVAHGGGRPGCTGHAGGDELKGLRKKRCHEKLGVVRVAQSKCVSVKTEFKTVSVGSTAHAPRDLERLLLLKGVKKLPPSAILMPL